RSGAAQSPATLNRDLSTIVAPFSVLGNDTEIAGLARGLGEDIATGLSRFPFPIVQTAQSGDARYRLEGTVRRSRDQIRVALPLGAVGWGVQMWAENYDRALPRTSLFDLQDDLTARVVATLADTGSVFVRAMGTPLCERPVESLSAEQLVVRYSLYITAPRSDEH